MAYENNGYLTEHIYRYNDEASSILAETDKNVYLKQLYGMSCGFCGNDEGPVRARGLVLLKTDIGRFEAEGLILKECSFSKDNAKIIWQAANNTILIESNWTFCGITGIISRKDRLINIGTKNITVFGFYSRFPFCPANYEIYSQGSHWCNENQGIWQDLHHGSFVLGCEGGRTSLGSTPYLCLRETGQNQGIAFHAIPFGNWSIRVSSHNSGGSSLPFAVVEIGMSEEDLKLDLAANGSFELPEILMHSSPEGCEHLGISRLHQYLLENNLNSAVKIAPLVFNTWFDDFDFLKTDRLRKQLKVAKDIGCEVFTVDAGWFGGETGNWYEQTGDWREKQDAAFHGRMQEFAEEVRSSGLGFGLWMEPERISKTAPVYKEHPEWFIPVYNSNYYPDISKPEVYSYILGAISHLIEKYKLAWIKIDFNSELGVDASGTELYTYYNAWYRIMRELKGKYPDLFIENCASGGLRMNISDLVTSDGFFISDTVYPQDVLRIYQGTLLRLPPGKLIKWAVLRSINNLVPTYGTPLENTVESIIAPTGATWESFVKVDIDFAIRVALPGMFGLGGDLAEMPQWALDRLKYHIAFYKKWREFMLESVAHLLTPVRPIGDESGWAAIQLQNPRETTSLLFVYRLDDACHTKQFNLRGLDYSIQYEVKFENSPGMSPVILYGSKLMNEGIPVKIPNRNNSEIVVIDPLRCS